jgi:hypothetical protein
MNPPSSHLRGQRGAPVVGTDHGRRREIAIEEIPHRGKYIVTAEDLQRGTEGALRRRCDRCDHDMAFLMEIMNVTTPGRTRLFECQNCEKMAFVPA